MTRVTNFINVFDTCPVCKDCRFQFVSVWIRLEEQGKVKNLGRNENYIGFQCIAKF